MVWEHEPRPGRSGKRDMLHANGAGAQKLWALYYCTYSCFLDFGQLCIPGVA